MGQVEESRGYGGVTYDKRQIAHRRPDTGDPHRLGFASNLRLPLTGLITTSRDSRHCPLVVSSGIFMKEEMASPVVKMGVSVMVMVIQHRMTILMMFEIMTTIVNGKLYSTVHLSGTLSLRQYLTLKVPPRWFTSEAISCTVQLSGSASSSDTMLVHCIL